MYICYEWTVTTDFSYMKKYAFQLRFNCTVSALLLYVCVHIIIYAMPSLPPNWHAVHTDSNDTLLRRMALLTQFHF